MARKPEQKPEGVAGVKRSARNHTGHKHDELAPPAKPLSSKGPHCGDMGLASREQQFRPGSGGR
jgi:hypothetical protein